MRQKDEMERTENARARSNRHILWLTYGIAVLFIAMAVYFGWFIQFKSENVIGSSYNARLDLLSDRVTRGSIMSNDKTVLAQTNVASDGSEKRYYPYDYLFVHSVGYSGKNGKTGLESLANFYLLSSHVNLIEKTINEFQGKKNLGDNVITTLDVDLQQTASDAIGKHRGAVIVMEPDTGKILTMVSQPNFNANLVDERWAELISPDNTKAQLVNRATQGLYPPGSTFKMLTVLEYMKENPNTWQDYVYNCNGSYQNGDYTIKCYHGTAHGAQNLIQAFANSCNAFYASLGMELDIDQFGQLCNKMLFNTSLPTDLQASKSSFVLDKSDGSSAIMATSIGQGQTLVTPFHMALLVSAINNDGVLMKPYVLDRVESSDGTLQILKTKRKGNYNIVQIDEQYEPEEYGTLMTTDEAAILKDYMNYVVETGTGKKLSGQSYEAAGKTGSAEYSTGADSSHSWFVGYAHRDDKSDIAIAVIVEKAGVGSEYAVPIAKEVFDAYYNE